MASSAVRSVIGKPFSAGSCFCFLSFAGAAAEAGTGRSTPSVKTQANESTMDRTDFAVAKIGGVGAGGCCRDFIRFSCRAASSETETGTCRLTPARTGSCGNPAGVSNRSSSDRTGAQGLTATEGRSRCWVSWERRAAMATDSLRMARNPTRIDGKCGDHFLPADFSVVIVSQ